MRAAARGFTWDSDTPTFFPYHTQMPLNDVEQQLCDLVDARSGQLLVELAEHVAIPTGHNHTPGLDAYRDILIDRLSALGAGIEHIPGDDRPKWIEQPSFSAESTKSEQVIPPTVIARKTCGEGPRILIVGHLGHRRRR